LTRIDAQLSQASNRDATVFGQNERLGFLGESGHLSDDGCFLTTIQSQDTLLKMQTNFLFIPLH
jgi:hypothetical protein